MPARNGMSARSRTLWPGPFCTYTDGRSRREFPVVQQRCTAIPLNEARPEPLLVGLPRRVVECALAQQVNPIHFRPGRSRTSCSALMVVGCGLEPRENCVRLARIELLLLSRKSFIEMFLTFVRRHPTTRIHFTTLARSTTSATTRSVGEC